MEIPLGWNSRHAPIYEEPNNSVGDWRQYSLKNKYVENKNKDDDPNLPIGWNQRRNKQSLEELSCSLVASDIAAAEVHLGKQAFLPPPPPQKEKETKALQNEHETEKTLSSTQFDTLMSIMQLLSGAVLDIDKKIQSIESKLDLTNQRLDTISHCQEELTRKLS